jgi:hypothetical protein
MTASKQCRKCGANRPRSEFYESNRENDGLSAICVLCRPIKNRTRKSRRTHTAQGIDEVLCSSCKEWLPANSFSVTRKGYYSSQCRVCNAAGRSEWMRRREKHIVTNILNRDDIALLSHPLYAQDKERLARYIVIAHGNYRASKKCGRRGRGVKHGIQKVRYAFQVATLDEYATFVSYRPMSCECCAQLFSETLMADWVVDHCHTTGTLRGLLCQDCNRGIGLFRDDVDILVRAKAYLEMYDGTHDVSSL